MPFQDGEQVSGLLLAPANVRACYVMAHGAGAGMNHLVMATVAEGIAERGIATLRYTWIALILVMRCLNRLGMGDPVRRGFGSDQSTRA